MLTPQKKPAVRTLTQIIILIGMTSGVVASAEENAPSSNACESIVREQRIAKAFESIELMAKMRNSAGSIRAVARNLLAQAPKHPSTRFDASAMACGKASAMAVYRSAITLPNLDQRTGIWRP